MPKPAARTVAAFDRIAGSSMFRTDGADIDLCPALIELAQAVHAEPSDNDAWLSLGEFGEFTCPDLIVGAYWALSEWHAGQYSPEYAALSALGDVFQPGMSSQPTDDEQPEYYPYKAIGEYFAAKASKPRGLDSVEV
jgi:hypothetical protein